MAKRNEPVVKVWGLQELDNSRLKQLDFGQRLGDGLWAYPVFTTREAALKFADMLTEDAGGPDAGLFRRRTRECVRQVNPREIPRAALVMVDTMALRDEGDNVASVMERWGEFYDRLVAETN